MGGHLATLTTREENDWAAKTFLKPRSRIWIGGQRVGEEWQWITGEKWDFTAWAKNEPSNPGSEDVLELCDREFAGWNDAARNDRVFVDTLGAEPGRSGYLVEWDSVQPAEAPMVAAVPSPTAAGRFRPGRH
jgi:hypothetical protein